MVENEDLQDVDKKEDPISEVETTKYPWMVREIKKAQLGSKLKTLMWFGAGLFILYLMFRWFSWYFLLGFLPAPAWFFWALRQIDKEAYILIEVRIKGDEYYPGKRSFETSTRIFDIPPDLWKGIKKIGSPFHAGNRIYICDYFFEDPETGEASIYFAEHSELSNVSFYAKSELWFELKKKLPDMERRLAIYRYNSDLKVMEEVTNLLEHLGILQVEMARGGVKKKVVGRSLKMDGVSNVR